MNPPSLNHDLAILSPTVGPSVSRYWALFVVATLLVGSLWFLPGSARPEPVVLKLATAAPQRSIWGKALNAIAEEVRTATEGQVKIQIFADGIQGLERTVVRKLRAGRLQGAGFLVQGLEDVCPDSIVLHLPLMFSDHAEAQHVFAGLREHLEAQCRENGYEPVAWPQFGFSYLFSRDEVTGVATLAAAKPWLVEDDVMMRATYKALGVTPVSAGVVDVLPSLQTGLIRTIFAPPSMVIALQWHTRLEYRLDLRINYSIGVILFTSKAWKRLSPEHQELIRTITARHITAVNERTRSQNREAVEVLAKNGMSTVQVDPASLERFNEVTSIVAQKLNKEHFSAEVLAKARKLIAEYSKKKSSQ